MNGEIFSKGTLIYVASYGPFYGNKGTILSIECIGEEGDEQVVFYLVLLRDEPGRALWLEHDAVIAVVGTGSGS